MTGDIGGGRDSALTSPFGCYGWGLRDCGNHEWYKATEDTDRCYHCEVGVRSRSRSKTPDQGQ